MRFIALFYFCLLGISGFTQNKSSFSLNQVNGQVHINIVISSGNLCNGIKVFRSTDSLNFNQIGFIPGYCGNLLETVSYNYTDTDPIKNQISYYKLELGLESSNIQSILVVDLSKGKYKVWPNPIQESGILYFENDQQKEAIISLFSLKGNLVKQIITTTSSVQINSGLLQSGTYVFSIEKNNEQPIIGKLIIGN